MNSQKLPPRESLIATALVLTLTLTMLYLSTQPANAEQTHNVTIQDYAFHPQSLNVVVGDTMVWTNNDPVIYTLWFVNASDQSTYLLSDPIPPGESWSWIFDEVVELKYYSFERLWITGFITVRRIPVGGIATSVDKLGLLAPYIALAIAVVAITIGTVYAWKRWLGKAIVETP